MVENEEQIKGIVRESTHQAVVETFQELGIDPKDRNSTEEFVQNMRWVTTYRKTSEKIGSTIIVGITTIVTGGIMAAIWAYVTKK